MPLVDAERDAVTDAETPRLAFMALFTADPGTDGANEATGGDPAYARQPVTWPAADQAAGPTAATECVFDLAAGDYTHAGYFDAATGGTYRGGNPLKDGSGNPTTVTMPAQGQLKVTGRIPVTAS